MAAATPAGYAAEPFTVTSPADQDNAMLDVENSGHAGGTAGLISRFKHP